MVKYENSKIYKIVDNTNGNIYIGSTVKKLSERLGQHRTAYKMFLDGKRGNVKSFEIIKNGDYDIILLEECKDITNKEQLYARERYYIDSLECVNKVIPGRTSKEWYEDNKDQVTQYRKQYYEENKDQVTQYRKQYYEINQEEILNYQKQYYAAHSEKIKQHRNEKVICPFCHCQYTRINKTHHQRSLKHQKNIKNQANTE